jgi:acyl-CoA reductase-like NAD-dependent aldehyde dehydrogenase
LSNLYTTVFADVPTGHKLWREEVFGGAVYKLNSIDAELESAYSSFNP